MQNRLKRQGWYEWHSFDARERYEPGAGPQPNVIESLLSVSIQEDINQGALRDLYLPDCMVAVINETGSYATGLPTDMVISISA
jgi:hypothetical protein